MAAGIRRLRAARAARLPRVGGHLRLAAAQSAGCRRVPQVWQRRLDTLFSVSTAEAA